MNGSSELPPKGEAPSQLKSSRALATALGFTPDDDLSERWLKVYTKPFGDERSEGSVILTFDTVYRSPKKGKPYQDERIGLAVRLGDGSAWIEKLPRGFIKKRILGDLGIEVDREGAIKKDLLRSDGYRKLYGLLREELEEGEDIYEVLKSLIFRMLEKRTQGAQFIEERLIPAMREGFPEFSGMVNEYERNKEVWFFGGEEKGKKTVPVIRFFIRPYRIDPKLLRIGDSLSPLAVRIEVGRSKIEAGQVDRDYFRSYGKPQTIAPPSEMQSADYPRASWLFSELDQAMGELADYLEKM